MFFSTGFTIHHENWQTHAFTPLDAVLAHFYLQCLAIPKAQGINNHKTSQLALDLWPVNPPFSPKGRWGVWQSSLFWPDRVTSYLRARKDASKIVDFSFPACHLSLPLHKWTSATRELKGDIGIFFWSSRSDRFFCSVVQSNAFAMTVGLVDT